MVLKTLKVFKNLLRSFNMRKIIRKVFYEKDIKKLNDYIQENNLQEKDIINITELDHLITRWTETASKLVLFHYECV